MLFFFVSHNSKFILKSDLEDNEFMRNFKDKVVVITGAGSGIGRSLAIQFANLGCRLAIADNSMDALQETEKLITDITNNISIHHLDVSKRNEVQLFADEVIKNHSNVHILINNAGVTLLDRMEYGNIDEFKWLMDINFYGVIYGVTMFLPYLKNAEEAHIVNISSISGIMAMPGQAAYNSSKFAVKGFTEALRMELCDTSVNVSCVHPGGIKTSIAKNARRAPGITASTKIDVVEEFNRQAITTSDKAALTIIKGIKKNKKRILIGIDAKIIDLLVRIFPNSYEKILRLENRYRERMDA